MITFANSNITRPSSTLLAAVYCFAISLTLPVRAEDTAAPPGSSGIRFQSYDSLRQHVQTYGPVEATIDFDCQLVFAAKDWTTCYVETRDSATMLFCSPEHSNHLRTLPTGTRLSVKGKVSLESEFIHVTQFRILDPTARLEPLDLSVVTHGAAARLNGLALFTGLAREIMLDGTVAYLFAWSGYVPYEVELHEVKRGGEIAKAVWNRMIKVSGSLTRNADHLEALYTIRAMNSNQLLEPELESITKEVANQFRVFEGQVQYSDRHSMLIVNIANNNQKVQTRFAHRIFAGDVVEIYQAMADASSNRSDKLVPSIVIRKASNPFPECIAWTSANFLENEVPSRLSVQAVVQQSRRIPTGDCELTLESDGAVFKAVVPVNDDIVNQEGFRPKDVVRVTGCSHFKSFPGQKGTAKWPAAVTIYAASSTDLQFISGPWRLSGRVVLYSTLAVASLLLLIAVWNQVLQSKVRSRTADLNSVTTHLRKSYEAIPKAVLVNDENLKVSGSNTNFIQLFGKTPVSGEDAIATLEKLSEQFAEPMAFHRFLHSAVESIVEPVDIRLDLASAPRILEAFSRPIIDDSGTRYGRFWAFEDVTEKLRIEAELLNAQKIALVEQLASGIAHDFNNVLAVVRSSLAVARNSDQHQSKVDRSLAVAEMAVDQAGELTHQLLDFSRRNTLTRRVCEVNMLLQHVYGLARHAVGDDTQVNLDLLAEKSLVDVDVNRLEQILLNLCLNARDAVQGTKGFLSISAKQIEYDVGHRNVLISVTDNGVGMTDEIRNRVFEAFFTTKLPGKGIGLGLAMAKSVIEQLGGSIDCESTLGKGSVFTIRLPIVSQATGIFKPSSKMPPSSQSTFNILLVDDDLLFRKSAKLLLESLGHQVVTAESGREALFLLDASVDFQAVFLDYEMPNFNGIQTYREIIKRHPKIVVAICSGSPLSLETEFERDEWDQIPFILAKPYRASDVEALFARPPFSEMRRT